LMPICFPKFEMMDLYVRILFAERLGRFARRVSSIVDILLYRRIYFVLV
jgi:hypothetical protein